MNGFQPISYGEVMPNININTDEIMQRLVNIQTYSSLILNNIGIAVNTEIALPEFVYNGEVTQTGYNLSYGSLHMVCARNYDFELGLNMENLTTQNFIDVTFKFNGETYKVYPRYSPYGYFYLESSYSCPLEVCVADKGKIHPNFKASPGQCGIKFSLNKSLRSPITLLGIGQVKTAWAVPQW